MSNSPNKTNKFARFLRNNVALLLIIFCVLAIATVVLVATLAEDTEPVDNPNGNNPGGENPGGEEPVDEEPVYETVQVYFEAPLDFSDVGMGFTDGVEVLFVFNQTLNRWSTHYGLVLLSDMGTEVCAMYDGTVIEVGYSYGNGNFVKIDHGNGIIATYSSLADDVDVVQGQVVEKGETIGAASTSANYFYMEGAHVRVEVEVDGQKTDPTPYVNGEIYFEFQRLVEGTEE